MDVHTTIKKMYSFRSKYVHGATIRESDIPSLVSLASSADDIVRRSFLLSVTDEKFNRSLKDDSDLEAYFLERIFR
jgi:hypothetical protein